MRSTELLEDEETTANSGELNLGMGSLIGIFFGLALVCGVFFGFGYMMGHRTPAASPTTPDAVATSSATAPKPSAQIAAQRADANRVVVPASSSEQQPSSSETSAASEEAPKTASLTPAPIPEPPAKPLATASPKPAPPTLAPTTVSATAPSASQTVAAGGIMVQIAAVKNRPDAEALAAALETNGFHATIRSEPQDKLLHVQVGPFENRDDAKAMRQKLANAGYNAFIK